MIFEKGDRIVFAGDSVTDMGRTYPIGEGTYGNALGTGYVRIIDNMLAVWYPELKVRITNVGINGNTSSHLLERFNDDVVKLSPNWVSICIGINDVWRQFDSPAMLDWQVEIKEYQANLEKMILQVKDITKGIFICSPYYIETNKNDLMRKRMDEYVSVCQEVSKKFGCYFVDFQKVYEDYCQTCHSSYLAWDRVHPNSIGATLMARAFLEVCGFDYKR